MTIVYVCYTCMDYNKHHAGEEYKNYKGVEIADSLTMAMEHVKEGHEVHTEVRDYEDEE